VDDQLKGGGASTVIATGDGEATLCLVSVPADAFDGFQDEVRRLAADGIVSRVEAEPQL
jgi:hypothetical protein